MDETPQEKLAKMMLGTSLKDWVGGHRGDGLSWDTIARRLHASTDGGVDYTGETLRRRYSA